MGDINITINVNISGVPGYYQDEGITADSLLIQTILLYFLGLIGIIIMMFNIPPYLIFMGLIALVFYSLPILMFVIALICKPKYSGVINFFDEEDEPFTYNLYKRLAGGGGIIKKLFKNFFAPVAYTLFNVFVALFWICYSLGTISETMLIALIIPCAYAMYYYPFVLFKAAKTNKKKWIGIVAGLIIGISLILYLCLYDLFLEVNSVLGIAFFFSMITILGTFAILLINLKYSKPKKRSRNLLIVYSVLFCIVAIFSIFILPNQSAEKYEEALQYIENKNYKEAREILLSIENYKDAAELYNSIKYKNLEIGETIRFGSQYKSSESSKRENLTWTVISVENGQVLLLSDAILSSIDSNSLSSWNEYNLLRNELLEFEYLFDSEEATRVVTHNYQIDVNGEILNTSDKLFLLSQEELKQYCSTDQIYSKKDTSYNDHQVLDYQMQDFDYEYVYSYYVRNVSSSGEWIIVNCESKNFETKENRYVGIRPAMYITIDQE